MQGSCAFVDCFKGVSLTGNSDSFVSDGVKTEALFTRTCVRVAQVKFVTPIGTCCILARLLKTHPISQHVSQNALRHA